MQRKRFVRLYTDYAANLYWKVQFSDGRAKIPVNILMTKETLTKNRRGVPFECVLATGIEAFAKEHPEKFPHEVKLAYVTRSAVYLIDKFKDGQPSHAVRYQHAFVKWVHAFDRMSKERFIAKYDGTGFVLNLTPARKYRKGESKVGGNGSGGSRSHKVLRGAMERAQAAGLLPKTMQPQPVAA